MKHTNTFIAAALVAALGLSACGGGDDNATTTDAAGTQPADGTTDGGMADGSDSMAADGGDSYMSDGMDGMDHGDMDGMSMGSAEATPADQAGGDLVRGDWMVLGTAPDDLGTIGGEALLARTDDGTVVTLRVRGLPVGQYASHVHAGSCAEDGGPHYKHDLAGGDEPPNEIHLSFSVETEGQAIEWTVDNPMVANDEALSVVIHEEGGPKLICADLA